MKCKSCGGQAWPGLERVGQLDKTIERLGGGVEAHITTEILFQGCDRCRETLRGMVRSLGSPYMTEEERRAALDAIRKRFNRR